MSILLITLLAFTVFSCASNSKTKTVANPALVKYKEQFTGVWFWDYGYDQEQFAKDYWYMYENGTTYIYHIGPDYNEWDKGTWAIIDDAEHGPSLVLNVTEAKVEENAQYDNVNAEITYRIGSVNDDEFFIYRYKRDTTAMGGWFQTFDPAVEQHLYRVNAGARENLVGTWNLNMLGNYYDFDAETISFSSDGIYEVCDTNQGKQVSYRGTYDVSKGKNGTELHVALNEINEGSSYKELNPGFEVWFDYCSLGNDIIRISRTHDIIFGEEHTYDEPVEIYFYRNQPLVTYTYHWNDVTITDYYPEGKEYKLLDMGNYRLLSQLPGNLSNQHLDGWYTNPDSSGEPITTLGGNDGWVKVNWNRLEGEETGEENERDAAMNVEFWANWSMKLSKNVWDPNAGWEGYNFTDDVEAARVCPDMKVPSQGDTLKVIVSATASKDFDGHMGLTFVDYSDGWNYIGNDWHYVKTHDKHMVELFEVYLENTVNANDNTQFGFNLAYNPDSLDEQMYLSDFTFEVLDDEAASRIADITYNYAGFTATRKAITGYNYYLPEVTNAITDVINEFPWFVNDLTFAGWYDNPEFTGEPLTVISAKNLKASTSIYGKIEVTTHEYDFNGYNRNDGYNWNTSIPAKPYISKANIHANKGETVLVAMSATLSYDLDGWIGLDINDQSLVNTFLGSEWHYVKTVNNKLQTVFPVTFERTANITSVDNLLFYFAHNPDNNPDKPLTLSDVKFVIVDDTTASSIMDVTFNFAGYTANRKVIAGEDYYLPEGTSRLSECFNEFPWPLDWLPLPGWYDNPEFKGEPLTVIPAKNGNKAVTLYGKPEVTTRESDYNGYNRSDGYDYQVYMPANLVSSTKNFHAKAGDTVLVSVSATLSTDLNGWVGIDLHDITQDDTFIGSEWHYLKTNAKKIQTCFPITLEHGADITSMKDMFFRFAYNPETCDKPVTFTDLKIEIADADPFASATAATEHVTATACNEGVRITVHNLKDGMDFKCVYPVSPLCRHADAVLTQSADGYSFIWPFCEKGKTYSFRINYNDENGNWCGEDFSVIAGGGVGEFDFTPFDQMPVTITSNAGDTSIRVPQFTKENLKKVYDPYSSIISGSCIGFVFCSCNSDRSDDCYEFESNTGDYPDFGWYSRGLNALMSGGTYSIFDDIRDWGVTRADVINRFSSGKYVFTRNSIHFKTIYDNADEPSEFFAFVNESNKVPFLTK